MTQASSWWSSSTSLAVGGTREQVGQAGQYHTPAKKLLLGRQYPPSSCRQPTGAPTAPHVPEPDASNPFFSQTLEEDGGWGFVQEKIFT